MKDRNDQFLREFLLEVKKISNGMRCESIGMSAEEVASKVKKTVDSPEAAQRFMSQHQSQISNASKKLEGKDKSMFDRAVQSAKYALSRGVEFCKKHWGKILAVLILIAIVILFKYNPKVQSLGLWLFGKGSGYNWNGGNSDVHQEIQPDSVGKNELDSISKEPTVLGDKASDLVNSQIGDEVKADLANVKAIGNGGLGSTDDGLEVHSAKYDPNGIEVTPAFSNKWSGSGNDIDWKKEWTYIQDPDNPKMLYVQSYTDKSGHVHKVDWD